MAYTFKQISTILNQIVRDATGRGEDLTTPRNTAEFVEVAKIGLAAGLDPIMNSLTQLIGRTVFSVRPYEPDVAMLDQDTLAYGNAVRKITPIFVDGAEEQPMFDFQPEDGQSTDHYTIKRPRALETIYEDFTQYMLQAPTVFENQLRVAFSGPDQLSDFMGAQFTAVNNEIASQKEALAMGTIANFIGAKLALNNNVRHMLTEYNTATGLTLTAEDVYKPDNFPAFIKWLYAAINDASTMMTKRSTLYHAGITDKVIMRHTPKSAQRLMMYSLIMQQIKSMALSGIYNDDLLKMPKVAAPVQYWQSPKDGERMKINVTAKYTGPNGAVATGTGTADNVLAVLFDVNAMGINFNLESVNTTPLNAKGLYYNTFYHYAKRYYNDITENAIVFILD